MIFAKKYVTGGNYCNFAIDKTTSLWDNIDVKRRKNHEEKNEPEQINPNVDYDENNLWGNISRGRGRADESYNPDEEIQTYSINPNADYDVNNLWGNISRGRADEEYNSDEEIQNYSINPNADYEIDSLWGNIVKGRGNTIETVKAKNTEEKDH